jgi:hypothetical protein
MEKLLPLLFLLACPLMMIFMMRGMHGGGGRTRHDGHPADPAVRIDRDQRIAELEQEVADLRHVRSEHSEDEGAKRRR